MSRTTEELEEQRMEEDRRMILDGDKWPRWPMLPLKRRDGDHFHKDFVGFMFADGRMRVYLGYIFAVGDKDPRPKTWSQALEGIPVKEYASIDELLAEYTVD